MTGGAALIGVGQHVIGLAFMAFGGALIVFPPLFFGGRWLYRTRRTIADELAFVSSIAAIAVAKADQVASQAHDSVKSREAWMKRINAMGAWNERNGKNAALQAIRKARWVCLPVSGLCERVLKANGRDDLFVIAEEFRKLSEKAKGRAAQKG